MYIREAGATFFSRDNKGYILRIHLKKRAMNTYDIYSIHAQTLTMIGTMVRLEQKI